MAEKIRMSDGVLVVPDEPIIPYVEGDGTGVDIWPASQLVTRRPWPTCTIGTAACSSV